MTTLQLAGVLCLVFALVALALTHLDNRDDDE